MERKVNLVREYVRAERIAQAAQSLVDKVEGYVEPKPGDPHVLRAELLNAKNELKAILNSTP